MPLVKLKPPAAPAINDRDYAIVVGIDHYKNGIPALEGAINDCELFCEWLVHPEMGGVDPAKVKYFISNDPSDDQPMRNQIEDFLIEFFDLALEGKLHTRRLYLFLAGHGLTPPPPDKRGCALVMANARMNALRGLFGVGAAETVRVAGLFEEVMLVMDCCAEITGPSDDLAITLPFVADPSLPARAFIHIEAAQAGKTAAERELEDPLDPTRGKSWHGVLTNALLRGLTTAVDENGNVTAQSLKKFLDASNLFQPKVEVGEADGQPKPMTFGKPRGIDVAVSATSAATQFQVREGASFKVVFGPLALPRTVYLTPGQYFFDGFSAAGTIVSSNPHSVRQGGMHVDV